MTQAQIQAWSAHAMCCAGTKGYQDLLKRNKGLGCTSFEALYLDAAFRILAKYKMAGLQNDGVVATSTINIFPAFVGAQSIRFITIDLDHTETLSGTTNALLVALATWLNANTNYRAYVSGNKIHINSPVGDYNQTLIELDFAIPPNIYKIYGMFDGGQYTQGDSCLLDAQVSQIIENVNILCGCKCEDFNVDANKFRAPVMIIESDDGTVPAETDVDLKTWADTRDPNVSDDISDGFSVNSTWVNTLKRAVFICINPALNNADWEPLASA